MTVIEQSEVETFLGFPVVTKAEAYVPTPGRFTGGRPGDATAAAAGGSTSLLIAAVIVSAFLVIVIIIALLFLMHRTGSKSGGGGLAAALKQRKLMSGTPTSATSGPSQGLGSQDKTSLAGSVRFDREVYLYQT